MSAEAIMAQILARLDRIEGRLDRIEGRLEKLPTGEDMVSMTTSVATRGDLDDLSGQIEMTALLIEDERRERDLREIRDGLRRMRRVS